MGPNKEIMEVHGVNQVMHSSVFFYFLTHLNKRDLWVGGTFVFRGYSGLHSFRSFLPVCVYERLCLCLSV